MPRSATLSEPSSPAEPVAAPPSPRLASAWILLLWALIYVGDFEYRGQSLAANSNGGYLLALAVTHLGYLFFTAALWINGKWRKMPASVAFLSGTVPFCLLMGDRISANSIFALWAFPWYAAASAFLGIGLLLWRSESELPDWRRGSISGWMAPWVLALGLGVLIPWIRTWTVGRLWVPWDLNSLSLFYMLRNNQTAGDIAGLPFYRYIDLWAPLAYFALIGFALAKWREIEAGGKNKFLLMLLLLAVVGKFAIAYLSTAGLILLNEKVASVNSNYLNLAHAISSQGLWNYLQNFNGMQFTLGAHGDTHSFAPTLLYWVLSGLCGGNTFAIGLCYSLMVAATAPLLYLLAESYYGSREAGVAAAFLFISSPMNLILSDAGIDAMVLLCVAALFRVLQKAQKEPHTNWPIVAGLVLFVGSMFSFSFEIVLVLAGMWSLAGLRQEGKSLQETLSESIKLWVPLLGTFIAAHLFLYALLGCKFNYMTAVHTALGVHSNANGNRPYEIWSWANMVLYAGYAGVATLALWLLRILSALARSDRSDPFLVLSLPFVLTLIFACMGRAEVEREFLFGVFFLALPAAPWFLQRTATGSIELRGWLLWSLLGLNILNAVILEIKVLDFW